MTGIAAVFRHEIRLLLYSPLSFLFLAGFLLALSSAIFLIADFYSTDEASIHLMLLFAPWVGIVLVPALAMGMWTDDRTDKSAEIVLTLPLSLTSIVIGKFLAGNAVLIGALLFTFPFPLTVVYLGEPDVPRILAGYMALALLLAMFFAIALFTAALVRDRVGAYIVGIGLLFIVMLIGWDVFSNFLKPIFSPKVIDITVLYSPRTWLLRMGAGLIDLAGLIYFLGGIGAALTATSLVVSTRRSKSQRGSRLLYFWASLTSLMLVAVPFIASKPFAFDWTAEKEYSLHDGSKNILQKLPYDTVITFYWSAEEAAIPVMIKSHARRIRKLLESMAAHANGKIKVQEIDPKPDTDEELRAISDGVRRIPMSSGDHFYLGLTITHKERVGNIPYLDIARDRFLEYDIAIALNGLTRASTPKIGVISPLLPSITAVRQANSMSFMAELKRSYDIAVIPYFKTKIPDGLSALLVIDASILRSEMLYAIDQFVMKGGSLIVMVDPFLRFKRGSNMVNPAPSAEINDISDLLEKWGVRYVHNQIVGDARSASSVEDRNKARISFPYWMRIRRSGLGSNHPASASLNEVFMVEPGALEFESSKRVIPLVFTSSQSGVQPRNGYGNRTPGELASSFQSDNKVRNIAAAIHSPFMSSFVNAPNSDDKELPRPKHLNQSTGQPVVFVVADVDWLFDPFSLQSLNISGRTVVRPLNDNLSFLLNLVEHAAGNNDLSMIRSRGRLQRPFTRVQTLFQKVNDEFRVKENILSTKVKEIEEAMDSSLKIAGETSIGKHSNSTIQEIKAFRRDLVGARLRLREVRRLIRTEVENLGRILSTVNLASGPTLVLILWVLTFFYRRRGQRNNILN